MRLRTIAVVMLFISVSACQGLGELHLDGEQVSVSVAKPIRENDARSTQVREHRLVETVHQYLTHRLRKMHMRPTLHVKVTITSYRIRSDISHIGAHVAVSERGEIIERFDETENTIRHSATRKLAKGLARRIYERIKNY